MSSVLTPILTEAGLAAILAADTSGLPARIASIALGDGSYSVARNSAGHAIQTALQNERERVAVLDVQSGAERVMTVNTVLDSGLSYWLREFGLFLDDGTLLAVWSNQGQALAYKSSAVDLYLAIELGISALPEGSVVFNAGGVDLDLTTLHLLASQIKARASDLLRQVRLFDSIRAIGA